MNHAASVAPPALPTSLQPNAVMIKDQPSNSQVSGVNVPVGSSAHESGDATQNPSGREGASASVRVLRSTEDIMACLQTLRNKNDPAVSAAVPAVPATQPPHAKTSASVNIKDVAPESASFGFAKSDPSTSRKVPSVSSEAIDGSNEHLTPPEQWGVKEKQVFHTLPPELQATISRHDQTVKAEADKLKKHQQAYEALHIESAHSLAPLVQAARAALMGDLAHVNWAALQNRNPQEYARLRNECDQRLAAIDNIHRQGQARFAEARQVEAANEQARLQAHIHKEFEQVVPTLKALMGEAYTDDFRHAVSTYLKQQDVPESALGQITNGYELKLIVKAMLYDRLMTTRDQAAAKVAGAPQVQHAKGRPVTSDGDTRERFHKARAALCQNPRSTDLIVQMLRASRG